MIKTRTIKIGILILSCIIVTFSEMYNKSDSSTFLKFTPDSSEISEINIDSLIRFANFELGLYTLGTIAANSGSVLSCVKIFTTESSLSLVSPSEIIDFEKFGSFILTAGYGFLSAANMTMTFAVIGNSEAFATLSMVCLLTGDILWTILAARSHKYIRLKNKTEKKNNISFYPILKKDKVYGLRFALTF